MHVSDVRPDRNARRWLRRRDLARSCRDKRAADAARFAGPRMCERGQMQAAKASGAASGPLLHIQPPKAAVGELPPRSSPFPRCSVCEPVAPVHPVAE